MINQPVYRSYQFECFEAVRDFYKSGGKAGMIVSATGTGKRMMSVYISTKFDRSLFICHTEELIEQAAEDFERMHPGQVGIVKAERFEIDKKVVIASIQTLTRRLDRINSQLFDLVQVDEVHLYMAKSYFKAVKHFTPKLLTTWTATPHRLDGLGFSNLVEKIVFEYPIDRAIKEGYLCELDAYRIKTKVDLTTVHKAMGDFKIGELSSKVDCEERNQLIVDSYIKYGSGRQGICFGVDTIHCQHLNECFEKNGISSSVIVSNEDICSDRKGELKKYKEGKTDMLISINILAIGFDYHNVGILLLARPTQSTALYLQQVGRSTRLKNEKYVKQFGQKAIILDFVDNFGKHNLINTWTLEGHLPPSKRTFMSKERKDEAEAKLKQRRESEIHSRYTKDIRVNLLELPKIKISNSYKMEEPATEPQLNFLKALGIYDENNEYTKGMASEFISNHPCEDWQKSKLIKWGYDATNATIGHYQICKKEYEELKNK